MFNISSVAFCQWTQSHNYTSIIPGLHRRGPAAGASHGHVIVTAEFALNSENPGIFQLITPSIEVTRAMTGSLRKCKLISARLPLGLNRRRFIIQVISAHQCAAAMRTVALLSLCCRSAVALGPGPAKLKNLGKPGKPWVNWEDLEHEILSRSLSHLTPPWLEGSFSHVSCTEPHREPPGAF